MATLNELRPDVRWSLEEFMQYSFEPGFEALCSELLGFTPEEMARQEENWRAFSLTQEPPMFPGMAEPIRRQRARGGLVCGEPFRGGYHCADYVKNCGFAPDLIFDGEQGPGRRKPSPWPLQEIMRVYGLAPGQLLMVDDLKPGWQMARAWRALCVWGWGSPVAAIHTFMRTGADHYFTRVEQLEELLVGCER